MCKTQRYLVVLAVLCFLGLAPKSWASCGAPGNTIEAENCLTGNPQSEWDITGAGDLSIQGFATDISVNAGSTINFKIKTDASAYTINIYRLGYYSGNGARKVATVSPSVSLPQVQPACISNTTLGLGGSGLTDCGNWVTSASWAVPSTAVSGVYVALLKRTDTSGTSHIIFIVRSDASHSNIVFQTSDVTWQAYNWYGTGSLYGPNDGSLQQNSRSYKVSYNRPFLTRSIQPWNYFFNAEYPMLRFLEANGYDVSYISGVDTDRSGALLLNHKLFLSVGHDEYWSGNQRTKVEAARTAGVNLAFFSGNEMFWKVRYENAVDGSGTPFRTLVCYKETHANAVIDPLDPPTWTGTWRDPRFSPPADGNRPENSVTGTLFMVNGPQTRAIMVPAEDGKMRFWRNTTIAGQSAGQSAALASPTLGFEWDVDADNGSRPAGLIHLSTSTYSIPNEYLLDFGSTYGGGTATHNMTFYKASSGALVFSAGTIQWPWGLDIVHDAAQAPAIAADSRMQQATVNLFADMGVQPVSLQGGLVTATASTDTVKPSSIISSPTSGSSVQEGSPVTISGTATDAGGLVGGVEVSLDGGTTWHAATGRGTWAYTWVPGNTGSFTIRSRAADDSGNIETPGSGVNVTVTPRSCPCSLFGTNVPSIDGSDTNSVELGLRFRSDVNGTITGIRYYKAAANTGTHFAHLWSNAGTLLASATFSGESASGWQQVTFPTPVAITAGVTYVASYFAPVGHYSFDDFAFVSAGIDNSPLHILKDGVDGPNGSFTYASTTAFPNNGFQSRNYYVDVVFQSGTGGGPNPTVTSTNPVGGASGISTNTVVSATFDRALNASTVNTGTFQLLDPNNTLVPATVTYNNTNFTATLTPTSALSVANTYTAVLIGGASGIKDTGGNPLSSNVTWLFTTCCSIFSLGSTPALIDSGDPNAVELGLRFRSDQSGFIHGLRFYKSVANTGTHVAHLWTNTGTLLATATVTGETASGWQPVSFPSAVPINAGTTYVASYFAPNGHYSFDDMFFATAGADSPPLHALKDGLDGANGPFVYTTTGSFPTDAFNSRNYWLDVLFTSNVGTGGPSVTTTSPTQGATAVSTAVPVTANFDRALNAATVTTSTFQLFDPTNTLVPATVTYNSGTFAATLTPSAPLNLAWTYHAVLTGGASGIKDTSGNPLATNVSWFFSTCCSIWNSGFVPTMVDSNDTNSVEVGVRFRSDVNGFVRRVRFYKGVANTGIHVAHLWSNTGTLLATSTTGGETASGWQDLSFASPVPVTAGTTYVASYFAPVGHYSQDSNYFAANGFDTVPLHALRDGLDGANGVFTYGASSAFPTSTFNSSNYWVDVAVDAVTVSTVTLNPTSVIGGNSSTGTVTLTGPAPAGGVTVALSSDNAAATVPASVPIAQGTASATFTVTTNPVGANATANITANYGSIKSAPLTVAAPSITSLTLNPSTLIGGASSTGTVTLTGKAPAGGATVLLSSNATAAQVPANVVVAANATSATFTVTTSIVTIVTSATITGSYNGSANSVLTVNPVGGGGLAIDKNVSTDRTSAGTTVVSPAFTTASANELLLAFISADSGPSGGVTVTGVTGGSLTWTLVTRTNTQPGVAEVWRAFAPTTLTSATVTATTSASVFSSITVLTFTGTDTSGTGGSGAIGAIASASGASGAPTGSLVTTRNNSWVIGAGTDWDNAIARTVGSNQTMVHQALPSVGSTYWVQRQTSTTPFSGTTVTINDTAPTTDKYNLALVEVLPPASVTPDFTLSATPASQTVAPGSATTYTATTVAQNGFNGSVSLSATGLPSGATASFVPTSITGSGSSTLTVSTTVATPVGTYNFTITGVSGSLTHSTTAQLVVFSPPPPGQLAIDANTSADGTAANTTITTAGFSTTAPNELLLAFVSVDSGPAGGVTVTGVSGGGLTWALAKRTNTQPGGVEIWRALAPSTLSNVSVTATLSSSVFSSITVLGITGVDTTGTSGSGAIGATASGTGTSGAPTASLVTTRNNSWVFGGGTDWDAAIARTIGPNQTMVHQALPSVGSTYWVQRQTSYTPLSGTTVTINDMAPTGDKYNLAVVEVLPASTGPDFAIAATPPSFAVQPGATATYTVTTSAQNAFAGTVTLSASGLPTGAAATFNPTTITGSGTSTMTVTTSATTTLPGNSTLTITGISGTLTHSTTVTLVVSPPPGSLAIDQVAFKDNTSTSTSVTSAAFSTGLPNELLLAFVSADSGPSGGVTVTGVSGGGLTWTLVKRANAQPGDAEIWKAFAPATLTGASVTASLSQNVFASITVVTFSGTDTTGAVGASATASAATGAPTVSLVTTRAKSWVIGVGTDWDAAIGRTVGTNQTLVHQALPSVGSTYWVQRQNVATPASGTTVTINDTAPTTDKYNVAIVEVLSGS